MVAQLYSGHIRASSPPCEATAVCLEFAQASIFKGRKCNTLERGKFSSPASSSALQVQYEMSVGSENKINPTFLQKVLEANAEFIT
jgi:hypothetical protein